MSAVKERWWPTRAPPTSRSTDVVMDLERREVVSNTTVRLPFHDVELAVVCQEGCYPEKASHVNQDCFLVQPNFGDDPSQLLLGVFDGHGGNGEHCAQIAASIFPKKLAARRADRSFASHGDRDAVVPHREWDADESLQSYSRAFVDASDTIVAELGDGAKSSGTTAVVAHVIGDMLHMANVGDSRAILGVETLEDSRGGFARWDVVEVTHDQTCFRNDERERMRKDATKPVMFATLGMLLGETPLSEDFGQESIEAADDPPRVFRNGASYPGCAFTRSLGDTTGKQLGVCATPELLSYQLDRSCRCLVVASDGVFEFMSNAEVLAVARRHAGDPERASAEIVRVAYQNWANEDTRSDDVTCVVAYFTPKTGAKEAPTIAGFGLPSSPAKRNWKRVRDVLRAGEFQNRNTPAATRFADAVLAKAAMDLRRRRGSLAMEELFPNFDWEKMSELQKHGSRKDGSAADRKDAQRAEIVARE